MNKNNYYLLLFFVVASGCAAVPVISGGIHAANYYSSKKANKTFTASFEDTRAAGAHALKEMGFEPLQKKGIKEKVYAFKKGIKISISIKPITDKANSVQVDAYRKGAFWGDLQIGIEIINQMEDFLGEKRTKTFGSWGQVCDAVQRTQARRGGILLIHTFLPMSQTF